MVAEAAGRTGLTDYSMSAMVRPCWIPPKHLQGRGRGAIQKASDLMIAQTLRTRVIARHSDGPGQAEMLVPNFAGPPRPQMRALQLASMRIAIPQAIALDLHRISDAASVLNCP